MNKNIYIGAISAFIFSLTIFSVAISQESPTIAKVGNRNITQQDLDLAIERLGAQFGDIEEAEKKKRVLSSMIDFTVLAQLAEKQGLDKDPETIKVLADLRLQALHNAYFKKAIEPLVTKESLQEAYDKEIANQVPQQEVKARHILLEEEQQAIDVIAELDAGADFAELAMEKSTGPSASQGGDLGFFTKGRMVAEFEEAAFAMEVGEYSKQPVKTQFGYHVILVEEKRDQALPTFEELEGRLRQAALARLYSETVEQQRGAVDIEILDKSLIE